MNLGNPKPLYYPNLTIETTATAAILQQTQERTARAAQQFLDFLKTSQGQEIFIKYGFRSINNSIELKVVSGSPWSKNIPGIEIKPNVEILSPSDERVNAEIIKLWERN